MNNKRILLIISGGIAAYKSLELIRLIKKSGASVRCILTEGGQKFITPLSVASLSGEQCYTDLWSLKDEADLPAGALAQVGMGHIRLSREADLVVVAPASADLISRMAQGRADDLAATTLLATDKPVLIAPAMNHRMWLNPATQDNIRLLEQRGITRIGPEDGDMACGEYGPGRMAEPETILAAITDFFAKDKPLACLSALVTSGPTYEPIDPVRFIGNRSSGKQGHAIAIALAGLGANVTLVSGPVSLPDPDGIKTVHVETAEQMLQACQTALPADIAVCAAAVGDWSPVAMAAGKIKKQSNKTPPDLRLKENTDILATLSRPGPQRPKLVIGFAAETENLLAAARDKLQTKGCDWIVANDVSEGVFGSAENRVTIVKPGSTEEWPRADKHAVAEKLAREIAKFARVM